MGAHRLYAPVPRERPRLSRTRACCHIVADPNPSAALGILFLVHLVAFADAPWRLWQSWTKATNVHGPAYYAANAYVLGLMGLAAWVRWRLGVDVAIQGYVGVAWEPVAWVGLAVGAAGLAVAVWSRFSLGVWFVPTGAVFADQEVVERGPYGWVRHPMYVGWWVFLVGAALAYDSLLIAAAAVLVLPGLWLIGRGEERLLATEVGEAYASYRRRVPAWVPRPPRGKAKS